MTIGEVGVAVGTAVREPDKVVESCEPDQPSEVDEPDETPASVEANGFHVRLRNFEGPFDLLLDLIGQRKLDVTEVALHQVTDEFIAYTKAFGARLDLDVTTEFLVVAATLLDLKAARLLPTGGDVEDPEDLALLEARDLLFARLLQYRAFKQVAGLLAELEAAALRQYSRSVALEDRYTDLLPEVLIGVHPEQFAELAAIAFRPRPVPSVGLDHLHDPKVSVAEEAKTVLRMLADRGAGNWVRFADIVADCAAPVQIVARFLGLLELYRQKAIDFEQPEPLGDLAVSWTGAEDAAMTPSDEDYL